jgi:putative CocE/NonD family hydrolase
MKRSSQSTFVLRLISLSLLLFSTGCEGLKWRMISWRLGVPQPAHSVVVDRDVMIPVRDGVRLAADIYRPKGPGKFPVVVTRTPYGKRNPDHLYDFAGRLFASQGYAFVVQDVRGKFASEGDYYPYVNEAKDGHDTFDWAGQQEWSTGKVGTYGFSYWGSTQWLSAPYGSKHLKAMVPIVTGQNLYRRWIYNGIFRFNDVLFWHYADTHRTARDMEGIDFHEAVRHLPIVDADDAMGADIPAYNDWVRHPTPDDYWNRISVEDEVQNIRAPALLIGGWYDYYLELMFDDFNRMVRAGGTHEARKTQILIGPWTHQSVSEFEEVDFGREAAFLDQIATLVRWYDHWLKGNDNGILDEGPVRIFVMGKNEWRMEKEWPLARTRYTPLYLHSNGAANSAGGDGLLDTQPAGREPPDRFTYDPADPVPSVGGTSIYGAAMAGPKDQREVEERWDVLVYTTAPLDVDTEITGPVRLTLYAASSARDTDFSAKLVDVYPDGKAINLRAGMVRARFRDSFTKPSFLQEGTIYRFEINVGVTSNLFKKGHRIRLEVSSSYFPEFGRNLNTGAEIATASEIVKAYQTIYHDEDHPSFILLPVIPVEGTVVGMGSSD